LYISFIITNFASENKKTRFITSNKSWERNARDCECKNTNKMEYGKEFYEKNSFLRE